MAIELPDGRSESNDVLEALRLRAVHARQLGYAVVEIAAILGVREETVSRWCSRYDRGGPEALPGGRTGRPIGSGRRLTQGQEQALQQTIETKSPQGLGIASALWTRHAVRELIHQQIGIRLPIRTVGEYLRRWGFTPQKPVRKAYKQDPKAVAEWLERTYPEIERRAAWEGGEIHWGDETGVRSTCQHSRGYARPGETPELTVPGSRFSVNMISTVTNQGKVRWMIYTGRMNAALFIEFLTRLIAGAAKKIFLIVDHLSVHEAAAVEQWLSGKTDRIEVFYLPKYAPERNPDEYLNCDIASATGLSPSRDPTPGLGRGPRDSPGGNCQQRGPNRSDEPRQEAAPSQGLPRPSDPPCGRAGSLRRCREWLERLDRGELVVVNPRPETDPETEDVAIDHATCTGPSDRV